ncbi:MAG TPA: hypothetical protein PLN21_06140 [Gemmatales bacterium]|nr:hypothetical protein [Gemmatales bacterium]
MNRWLWLLALGLAPCNVVADDPKTPPAQKESAKTADSAKDEFVAIQKEWQTQQSAFGKKYQAAAAEDRQKLFETDYPKVEPFAQRCLTLAEKWPTAPEAADALFWALSNNVSGDTGKKCCTMLKTVWLDKASLEEIGKKLVRHYYLQNPDLHQSLMARAEKEDKDPKVIPVLLWLHRQGQIMPQVADNAKKAQELILTRFIDSKEIGNMCQLLGDSEDTKAVDTLKTILEKNSHDNVKAAACYGLGKQLGKVEATQAEAEKYLEQAIKDFPQAGEAVKALAKGELHEVKYLAIGKVIPEVKGKDLDDKEFKLMEYRGKVVLLDFWGFW